MSTTPNPTRGDALADAVARVLTWTLGGATRSELDRALAIYRSSAPTGELVRIAVWIGPGKYRRAACVPYGDALLDDGAEPAAYIVATIPPRAEPVVVEGSVET